MLGTEAYGLEKSAISEHFIEASRAKLKDMMEHRLEKTRLCALLIDATPFEGQQMVAALGIAQDGLRWVRCGPSLKRAAISHGATTTRAKMVANGRALADGGLAVLNVCEIC